MDARPLVTVLLKILEQDLQDEEERMRQGQENCRYTLHGCVGDGLWTKVAPFPYCERDEAIKDAERIKPRYGTVRVVDELTGHIIHTARMVYA